jgi:hypothetical protein
MSKKQQWQWLYSAPKAAKPPLPNALKAIRTQPYFMPG